MKEPSLPALDVRLPAQPDASSRARHAVHAVAAGRVADIYALDLAVSEAVTNVIVHAYRERMGHAEPGPVRVEVNIDDGELLVAVTDDGIGMVPRTDSPGAGLGLGLIATLADRLDVEQRATGTRLLLGFRLRSAADGPS